MLQRGQIMRGKEHWPPKCVVCPPFSLFTCLATKQRLLTSPRDPGVVSLHVNASQFSTTARRVTSPTWGPPPPCKQALRAVQHKKSLKQQQQKKPQYEALGNNYRVCGILDSQSLVLRSTVSDSFYTFNADPRQLSRYLAICYVRFCLYSGPFDLIDLHLKLINVYSYNLFRYARDIKSIFNYSIRFEVFHILF